MKNAIENIEIPKDSLQFSEEYIYSKKLSDDFNQDIFLIFEKAMVYAFDYLYKNDKILIPELNPVMIFYSNAVMSYRKLIENKETLLVNSPQVKNFFNGKININHFGLFFQSASNSIINLQATLESFANRIIPEDYLYIDKFGNQTANTITFKLNNAIPKIKGFDFGSHRSRTKYNKSIDNIIKLRNDIIHLKPAEQDSGYRKIYRELLNFDYLKALVAVKTFVNFYEPNLIEECLCGKEFYYDLYSVEKQVNK